MTNISNRHGKIIFIEGVWGSGKTTLINVLKKTTGKIKFIKEPNHLSSIKEERVVAIKRLEDAEFRAACHVHRLMRRALALHEANMAKKDEADKAKEKATVEHADFLLKGAEGMAFVKHARFNETAHPWALVERKSGKIRIVEANPSEGLFPGESKEFAAEGEEFAGLDKTLRNFLRYAKNKAGQATEERSHGFDDKEEADRAAEALKVQAEEDAKYAASQVTAQA